ncbi:hypothetical protein ACFV3R_06225 [Streptomyces sp. NPDC059740]|uniref:hypothetical protein n=1 Tax=Streptomyces sp. NPDC059740 TaxID=3346926 RepID=UPI00365B70B7
MPADEPLEGASTPWAGEGTPAQARGRTGAAAAGGGRGRHAAPRKPLFNRLHLPAGKAIALAAMPSAVLMGMGLTPQLALAKPQSQSPFRDGPCVSAPDSSASPEDGKSTDADKKKQDDAGKSTADSTKSGKDDTASGGDTAKAGSTTGRSGGSDASAGASDKTAPSATPAPGSSAQGSEDQSSEKESENPWYDPLGLGKVLGLGGSKDDEAAATPSASPSPSGAAGSETAEPKAAGSGHSSTGSTPAPGKGSSASKDDAAKDDSAKGSAAKDPAGDGKATATPSPSASEATGQDGKKPFPCVVEKKVDGTDEQTPGVLPDTPWHLDASSLTLRSLDYKGVVNVTTANGTRKQVLKFTADSIDIGDLKQTFKESDGTVFHTEAAKGSTSKFTGGPITMYTERLQGNLFGLIPIVFDAEHPPPINVPFAIFTDVSLDQAGQFGGNLHIPGLHAYSTS